MADRVTIEQLDAVSREVCRLFADDDRITLLSTVTAAVGNYNNYEVALIVAMAVARMAPSGRQSFISFLTRLCGVLNDKTD